MGQNPLISCQAKPWIQLELGWDSLFSFCTLNFLLCSQLTSQNSTFLDLLVLILFRCWGHIIFAIRNRSPPTKPNINIFLGQNILQNLCSHWFICFIAKLSPSSNSSFAELSLFHFSPWISCSAASIVSSMFPGLSAFDLAIILF